jgi:hypothetical protein
VFFHQGAPALGDGTLRTDRDLNALRAAAAAHLSPAGQLQVAVALDMLADLETRLDVLRHRLLAAARHLTGARVLAERLYGVGPVTGLAMTCWLGGAGRFSSARQAVRFRRAGHHRVVLGSQGPARAAIPAGPAGAALGGVRGRQDPRPRLGPRSHRPESSPRCHPPRLRHRNCSAQPPNPRPSQPVTA